MDDDLVERITERVSDLRVRHLLGRSSRPSAAPRARRRRLRGPGYGWEIPCRFPLSATGAGEVIGLMPEMGGWCCSKGARTE